MLFFHEVLPVDFKWIWTPFYAWISTGFTHDIYFSVFGQNAPLAHIGNAKMTKNDQNHYIWLWPKPKPVMTAFWTSQIAQYFRQNASSIWLCFWPLKYTIILDKIQARYDRVLTTKIHHYFWAKMQAGSMGILVDILDLPNSSIHVYIAMYLYRFWVIWDSSFYVYITAYEKHLSLESLKC